MYTYSKGKSIVKEHAKPQLLFPIPHCTYHFQPMHRSSLQLSFSSLSLPSPAELKQRKIPNSPALNSVAKLPRERASIDHVGVRQETNRLRVLHGQT